MTPSTDHSWHYLLYGRLSPAEKRDERIKRSIRVRDLRDRHGWTFARIARRLGVTRQTVSAIYQTGLIKRSRRPW